MNINSELVKAQLEQIDSTTESATIKSRVAYDLNLDKVVYSDGLIWKDLANFSLVEFMPIGSIIPSMLTEAQFQSEVGSAKWVLCDGRSSIGTDYITLGPSPFYDFIPDARGVFLRGKNNGISLSLGNQAGETPLGGYQGDQFKSHNHGGGNHSHTVPNNENLSPDSTDWTAGEWGGYNAPISANVPTSSSGNIITTQGGAETNPRNITVNYFIKVNR